jgi:2-amino-1-hydroxyethylphosphonate dioxygenase (glycine-forming)
VIDITNTVDEVMALYELHGQSDYIGEPVSQLEHMVQSAQLAEQQGYDDEIILAAFLHDVGHLVAMQGEYISMSGYGAVSHEKIGAEFLRSKGFSERIALLVESHVEAKRYLTHKYPAYYNNLSEASRRTLKFQGRKMSEVEAALFEQDELYPLKIQMRRWDEQAKQKNCETGDLSIYKNLMITHLSGRFNQLKN